MKSPVQGTVTSQDANHVAAFCAALPSFSQHPGRMPQVGDKIVAQYLIKGVLSLPFTKRIRSFGDICMNNSRYGIIRDWGTDGQQFGSVYRNIVLLGFEEVTDQYWGAIYEGKP